MNLFRFLSFRPGNFSLDSGLPRDSKAQAEQVRSVAVERVGERVGELTGSLMSELDDALRLHLSL